MTQTIKSRNFRSSQEDPIQNENRMGYAKWSPTLRSLWHTIMIGEGGMRAACL